MNKAPEVRTRSFPAGWIRWARSSGEPGDVCRHPEHAPTDYEVDWPDWESGQAVEIRACGTCWPPEQAQACVTARYRRIIVRRGRRQQQRGTEDDA